MSELKPTEESDTIELERKKEILEPMFEKVQTPTQNDGLYEEAERFLDAMRYRVRIGMYEHGFNSALQRVKGNFKHLIQSPSDPQAVPKPSLVECVEKRICKFCRYWDEVEYCGKHDSETVGQDYCSYFTENQIRPKQLAEELER